jgi:hypothetical protein
MQVHLRGLAKEFEVSTNTVRQELNILKELKLIQMPGENEVIKGLSNGAIKQLSDDGARVPDEGGRIEGRGNKSNTSLKQYTANTQHPIFSGLQKLLMQHTGLEAIIERVLKRVGSGLQEVYVTGELAKGNDSPLIDLLIIGQELNEDALHNYIAKTEELIQRKIRIAVYDSQQWEQTKEDLRKMPMMRVY